MIAQGYLFGIMYALLCLGIGFGLYKLGCEKFITRKLVHILVGFEWIILYRFFGGGIHFLLLCLLFLGVLTLSHKKRLLPMIESESDNSPGTVYYALAMSIMAMVTLALPDMIIPFGIGVFCTSLGDGFAGLIGQLLTCPKNPKIFGNKTLCGSLLNFIICLLVIILFNLGSDLGMTWWQVILTSLFATFLELVTGRGLDNITVTLGAAFLSYMFVNFNNIDRYVLPILLTPVIISLAERKGLLTKRGIICAFAVDLAVSIAFGNYGFALLVIFLLGGAATDKVKKHHKNSGRSENGQAPEGEERRGWRQVLANSFIAVICALLYAFEQNNLFVIAFTASLAEALSDTAASGIGALSERAYDPFRLRPCRAGISGGMSVIGTVASLIAAVLVGIFAIAFGGLSFIEGGVVVISAFLGAFFDSLLGSLLQIKYKCRLCGEITECPRHCGEKTLRHSGISFVDNNVVNLLGTLFASLFASLLHFFIIL